MNIDVISLKIVRNTVEFNVTEKINQATIARDVLKEYIGDSDREVMAVIFLDTQIHITGIHTISIGSLNSSIVHPREVFKAAILCNASSIIIGHNHPSSMIFPSIDDINTTKRLIEASKVMGITILDHIIVSDTDSYFSFLDEGLI
jgi:DNA repair protein RadC